MILEEQEGGGGGGMEKEKIWSGQEKGWAGSFFSPIPIMEKADCFMRAERKNKKKKGACSNGDLAEGIVFGLDL